MYLRKIFKFRPFSYIKNKINTSVRTFIFRKNFLNIGAIFYSLKRKKYLKEIKWILSELNSVNTVKKDYSFVTVEPYLKGRLAWAKHTLNQNELDFVLMVYEKGARHALKSGQFTWLFSYIDALLFNGYKEEAITLVEFIKSIATEKQLGPDWIEILFRLQKESSSRINSNGYVKKLVNIDNISESKHSVEKYEYNTYNYISPASFEKGEFKKQREIIVRAPFKASYFKLNCVYLYSGTLFDNQGNYILVDSAAHPASGFVSGQWNVVYGATENVDHVLRRSNVKKKLLFVEEAIVFHGRNYSNFFHWLIEYVPRLMLIAREKKLESRKIIIPANLPFQFWEVLELIGIKRNRIKVVNNHSVIRINSVIVPSFVTSIYDNLDTQLMDRSGYLNIPLMRDFRNLILMNIRCNNRFPKRIFLLRPEGARGLINQKQVVSALKKIGVQAIDPAKLLYKEQVEAFMNAELIVGVAGAAFANIFLCNENCKIVSLIAQGNDFYSIQPNLASIANASHYYVSGARPYIKECYDDPVHHMHSDFSIKISDLLKVIEYAESS